MGLGQASGGRDANRPAKPAPARDRTPGLTAPRTAAFLDGQVKSAGRVLDILEFYAERRKPATIQEVAVALHIPHSSVSALLNSLRVRDYLDFDPRQKTFSLNLKLLRLTNWLLDASGDPRRLFRMLEQIQADTGETVLLASADGGCVRYDQVLPSFEALQMALRPGTRRPLHRTATGIAILAALDQQEQVAAIKLSLGGGSGSKRQMAETLALVDAARRRGWHESDGSMSPGLSVVAATVERLPGSGIVAIGIGGPSARISAKRHQIITALEHATGRPMLRGGSHDGATPVTTGSHSP